MFIICKLTFGLIDNVLAMVTDLLDLSPSPRNDYSFITYFLNGHWTYFQVPVNNLSSCRVPLIQCVSAFRGGLQLWELSLSQCKVGTNFPEGGGVQPFQTDGH